MDCAQYHIYFYSYITDDYPAIPPEQMEHLQTCPTCRRQIEVLRQAIAVSETAQAPISHEYLALHFRLLDQTVDCTSVKPFLPLLAMTTLPLHCRTPITAHLESCSACQADLKSLSALQLSDAQLLEASRTLTLNAPPGEGFPAHAKCVLSAMCMRPASGVWTVATLSGQDADDALQVTTLGPAARPNLRVSRRTFSAAAAGLAAALVLIAALLFVGTPSAGVLDLRQFYNSLAEVQNVSIRTTTPEETEPVQHLWISQTQGIRLFKSPEKTVLYDVNARKMTLLDHVSLATQIKTAESMPADFQLPWGLLPFRNVTQISTEFQWRRVDTHPDGATVIYELSWIEPLSGGRTIEKKWIGYLDRTTHLPSRIDWHERFGEQSPYRLMMTMEITYPQTDAVLDAVRDSGL